MRHPGFGTGIVLAFVVVTEVAWAEGKRAGPTRNGFEYQEARKVPAAATAARLVNTCGKGRLESLTPEERARYCRSLVRVVPAAVRHPATPSAPDHLAIETAVAPLRLVQPPQIEANRASALAERSGAAGREFAIVALKKDGGTWRVESITSGGAVAGRPDRQTAQRR
jgi:hypothetical protein